MMFFQNFGGGVEMKGGGGGDAVVNDDYGDNQQQHMGGFFTPKQHLLRHHDRHQQQQKTECYSDEVDSHSGDGVAVDLQQQHPKRQKKSSARAVPPPPPVKATGAGGGEDGATVEVSRRLRGRPPGSKNKPKPPIVITRDADDAASYASMLPHVLEVPAGQDVVDALSRFSRRHNLGLCVLAGTGVVSNVALRHACSSTLSPAGSADLSFPGHFEILSISATLLPPSFAPSPPSTLPEVGAGVSVSLAGPHGQVFGGLVDGPLTAAGAVIVLAAAFRNPSYHRLPAEDEVSVSVSVSVSGGGDVEAVRAHAPQSPLLQRQQHNTPSQYHQQQHLQQQHRHHLPQRQQRSTSPPSSSSAAAAAAAAAAQQQQHHHPAAALAAARTSADVGGMSIYSCHLPSDVIWAPAARSPPY